MDKNPYDGVNPHLNSYLQNPAGRWEGFHSVHITHLLEALEEHLPEGYASAAEESLQISRIIPSEGTKETILTKADVLVYQRGISKGGTALAPTPPIATLALEETTVEDETLTGILIYRLEADNLPGIPVTRVELLSPANKPGGSHYGRYMQKRIETLRSGLNLVEIDLLHQFPPILPSLPSYASGSRNAYPFLVIVSQPHPTFEQGKATVYGSFVDMPLPTIVLPLSPPDSISFDLNEPYNRSCLSTRIYRQAMDYNQRPINFERYTSQDQTRILERMKVLKAE